MLRPFNRLSRQALLRVITLKKFNSLAQKEQDTAAFREHSMRDLFHIEPKN